MTDDPAPAGLLASARTDRLVRTRRHARDCVVLAMVVATDVAAALIDEAVALHLSADRQSNAVTTEVQPL